MNTIKTALIISALLLGACNSENKTPGVYVNDKNISETIELKADGSFVINKKGSVLSGHYEYSKGQLKLMVVIPDYAGLKEGTITDSSGNAWRKPQS